MLSVMREFFRRWWPILKLILFLAILVGVGWQFARILRSEELQQTDQTRSPGEILLDQARNANAPWLLVSGLLYVGGLGFCASFWIYLLRTVQEPLPWLPGIRGYYLSHLGKYVPGKGVALAIRAGSAAEAGISPGAAVLTAVYETLTTMASGALLAALLVVTLMRDQDLLWKVLVLLALAGLPIVPGVFNRLVQLLSSRLVREGGTLMQRLRTRSLMVGLLMTAGNWFLLGASMEALLVSLGTRADGWTASGWLHSTAFVAASWVAGFLTPAPGGLGVRELILQQLLAPQMGPQAVVVVLFLRFLWTLAEVLIVAVVWWFPSTNTSSVLPVPIPSAPT